MGIANGGEWGGAAAAAAAAAGGKGCDSCKAAAAAVFCRVDTAFLCLSCDAKIHCANRLASRHERVWMCEVCEQAPAAVTCKADAAALCVSCDADIHSANPLAQRHDRVPIEPFFDSTDSLVRSSAADAATALNFFSSSAGTGACTNTNHDDDDYSPSDGACHPHHDNDLVVETSPWIISNAKLNLDAPDLKSSGEIFFSEMDSFLDFDYSNNPIHGTDSVVPVKIKPISPSPIINHPENCFDIDFCRSKLTSFTNYASHCLSHSVSSSSLDVGVVPDGNSINEISYTFGRSLSKTGAGGDPIPRVPASATSTSTSTSTTSQATQLCGLDREARVLRYREKRKNRKFEKTIRYASRKAYAETRPRIKGRFAKRTEIEIDADVDADQIYGGGSAFFAAVADSQYGVVPTF